MSEKSERKDGMRIDWDVRSPWTMGCPSGRYLPPPQEGKYPVILSYGPTPKASPSRRLSRSVAKDGRAAPGCDRGFDQQVPELGGRRPGEVGAGRYVCVRVDSRGCGRSPGYIDPFSPRETRDFYLCIEWAEPAVEQWKGGPAGNLLLCHQSVARGLPAAPSPGGHDSLEGAADCTGHGLPWRDPVHLLGQLVKKQVMTVQHGLRKTRYHHPNTGELACGLRPAGGRTSQNRTDLGAAIKAHRWTTLPPGAVAGVGQDNGSLLSSANWGEDFIRGETSKVLPRRPPPKSG